MEMKMTLFNMTYNTIDTPYNTYQMVNGTVTLKIQLVK